MTLSLLADLRSRWRPVPAFQERLKACLVERKLSARALSLRLGMEASTVSCWLRGISRPNISMLLTLCRLLEVDPNYLLGWDRGA